MNKGQDIIIHFSGILNEEMANEVDAKISKNQVPNSRFIFDFSILDKFEDSGIHSIENICNKIESHGSKIIFSGINQDFLKVFRGKIPIFHSIEDAKKHFNDQVENKSVDQLKNFNKGNASVFCPSCNILLNIKGKGNYSCPACSSRFFIHSNGRISRYEKLL